MSIRSRLVSQSNNKLISNSEQLINATDLSPITYGEILPPKLRRKISTKSQTHPGTLDVNQNSQVPTNKKLLDRGGSASIVRKDILYERHQILKEKMNK